MSISTAPLIYLSVYFKTLKFLLVVNSGVIRCVVKMDSFSITAEPGKINLISCICQVNIYIFKTYN